MSETLQQWGFFIISTGCSKIPAGHSYPPVKHPKDHHFSWENGRILDSYTLVYIARGTGIFESKLTGKLAIPEHSLFIVYPGVWHRYRPDFQVGWEEYWIEFNGQCAKQFLSQKEFTASSPIFTLEQDTSPLDQFTSILRIAEQEPYGFEYLLSGCAVQILAHLLAVSGGKRFQDCGKNHILSRTKAILIERKEENIDLEQLADQMHVSYSWLRRRFKEYTGFSLRQYQLELRIHRACQLLRAGSMSISDISDLLGFSSVYYFSQLFKKKNGHSPMSYRKRCHDNDFTDRQTAFRNIP